MHPVGSWIPVVVWSSPRVSDTGGDICKVWGQETLVSKVGVMELCLLLARLYEIEPVKGVCRPLVARCFTK